ncbi:MAG: NAD(P)H-dependent oxidoreductase subunit E [Nostocoides sp.]
MDRRDGVRALAQRHTQGRGPLLPILHEVMDVYGWIAQDDITVIADVLNLSRAEVVGVVSFYDDFATSPPTQHVVRICRGEACQAVGAEHLATQTSAEYADNPQVTVEEAFCFGNCALGPSAQVDGRLIGRAVAAAVRSSIETSQARQEAR